MATAERTEQTTELRYFVGDCGAIFEVNDCDDRGDSYIWTATCTSALWCDDCLDRFLRAERACANLPEPQLRPLLPDYDLPF